MWSLPTEQTMSETDNTSCQSTSRDHIGMHWTLTCLAQCNSSQSSTFHRIRIRANQPRFNPKPQATPCLPQPPTRSLANPQRSPQHLATSSAGPSQMSPVPSSQPRVPTQVPAQGPGQPVVTRYGRVVKPNPKYIDSG